MSYLIYSSNKNKCLKIAYVFINQYIFKAINYLN